MDEDMIYKCLDCGEELFVKRASKVMDGRSCSKCNGHVVPNRFADNPKHTKPIGSMTIEIKTEGYERTKQQLRNLEATFDRILEKQERVSKIANDSVMPEVKALECRIDELTEYIRNECKTINVSYTFGNGEVKVTEVRR